MQNQIVLQQTDSIPRESVRLHYLDALRVVAVFMVFLFHSSMPFILGQTGTVNNEISLVATMFFGAFLAPWGMPFFFLLSGTAAWFALQRRTARQFGSERFRRLLVPFLIGCVLFTPFQAYFEWESIVAANIPPGLDRRLSVDFVPAGCIQRRRPGIDEVDKSACRRPLTS